MGLDLDIEVSKQITMRTVLSSAQKIYDILQSVVLLPKLILQQSFIEKKGWDNNLDDVIKLKFLR